MDSDGTPVAAVRAHPRHQPGDRPACCGRRATSSTARSSTSAATTQNYQVREVAEIIAETFPGCELVFGDSSEDTRNYRANFDKIRERLPGSRHATTCARGAQQLARRLPGHRHVDRASSSSAATRGSSRSSTCSRPARSTSGSSGSTIRRSSSAARTRRRRRGARRRRRRRPRHEVPAGRPGRFVPRRHRTGSATTAGSSPGSGTKPSSPLTGSRCATCRPTCRPAVSAGRSGACTGRSRRTASRSSCVARGASCSTSRSTCARTRRRSATGRVTGSTRLRTMVFVPGRLRPWLPVAGGRHRGQLPGLARRMCPDAERGIRWDDPSIGIEWPIVDGVTVSDKDRAWPDLEHRRCTA